MNMKSVNNKRLISTLFPAFVLCPLTPAMASDEDIYFSEFPVVASVSRLPQALSEAPGAVTVIDREMIRASGARNFADLLRFVPGFQVTPPNQDSAVVAYHGLSNEEYTPRVQVLIDGRSQYSPLFRSGVNWNLLPIVLDNIERIEVIRGSNTVAYGSNAFLGVVNIITQDPSQTHGWTVSANHGNASIRDQMVRWGGRVGEADMRLTAQQTGDDGFRQMQNGSARIDPHDSRHSSVLDLRVAMPLTNQDELNLSLNHAEDRSQYGRPNSTSDPYRDYSQNGTAFSVEWLRALGNGEELRLRYSHVQNWMSGRYLQSISYSGVTGANIRYTYPNDFNYGESTVDELEFQRVSKLSDALRSVWGAGTKYISLYAPGQFYGRGWQERKSARTFGNLEWRPYSAWVFNAGGSLEYDSVAEWMFDPRLSASYHITPEHTVRLIASRAHRSPSLYEAYGDARTSPAGATSPLDRVFLATAGLEPERIDTIEVGYLGELKSLRTSLDVRGFRERIPNRIQIIPYALPSYAPDDREKYCDRGVGVGCEGRNTSNYPYGRADSALNLEHVLTLGYEYQLRWQPFDSTRLIYSHAYIKIFADLTDETVVADNPGLNTTKISRQTRESAPQNSQSLMWIQKLPYDIQGSVMYYKSDTMRWLRNSYTSPYERVDWRLAKTFNVAGAKVELAYTAQMANHDMEGRRNTRVANEMHWLSARVNF